MTNGTQLGEEHLRQAREHLNRMDFVIIHEHFSDQFMAYFGIAPPHTNPNPYYPVARRRAAEMTAPNKTITVAQSEAILRLNMLDYRLYSHALSVSERLVRRGPLHLYSSLGKIPSEVKEQIIALHNRESRSSTSSSSSDGTVTTRHKHNKQRTNKEVRGNPSHLTVRKAKMNSVRCFSFDREHAERAFGLGHSSPSLRGDDNLTEPEPT